MSVPASPTTPPAQMSSQFKRVAVVDDVFAGPKLSDVRDGLPEFCAAIAANEEAISALKLLTSCDFSTPAGVSDGGVGLLHKNRSAVASIAEAVGELFQPYDQRRGEVDSIGAHLETFGLEVKTFHSIEKLFDGEPFQLVLLDLVLAYLISASASC
jgi:hypothetical protein